MLEFLLYVLGFMLGLAFFAYVSWLLLLMGGDNDATA